MPLYEYPCRDCAAQFERIERASPPKEGLCPECGGVTRRLIGAPYLQFKGSGWYVNDYGKGNAKPQPGVPSSSSLVEGGSTEPTTTAKPKTPNDSKVA